MPGWLKSLLLLVCLLPGLAGAQELIESFDVTLQVEPDGNLLVTERITVQAEGREIRRGIFREIPTRYGLEHGLQRKTPITLLGVTRDGRPEPVREESSGHGVRFYLGSADRLLDPGRYRYELRYRLDAQLAHRDTEDELYWNVTGNAWSLPILAASAEVLLPAGAAIGALSGYTGVRGSRGTDYRELGRQDNRVLLATTRTLHPGEGFTLAIAWPAGLVERPAALAALWRLLQDNLAILFGGLCVLGLLAFYGYQWHRLGRDPAKGLIIARFSAPEGLSPAAACFMWHRGFAAGKTASRELGISLTDMAIRRLLRLADDPESGGLRLLPGDVAREQARAEEKQLLDQLFSDDAQPLLLRRRYEPRLAQALQTFATQLKLYASRWFDTNSDIWRLGLFIASGCSLLLLLPGQGSDTREMLGLLLGCAVAGGIAVYAFDSGSDNGIITGVISVSVALILLVIVASRVGDVVMGLVLALWLQVILFRFLLRAPTRQTRQLLDELEGYREYLRLAEGDSLARVGTAPAMSIALYEQHLPYAMALGVEAQWTARFSHALQSGAIEPELREYRPDWFSGRDPFGATRGLTQTLASASTPPPSPRLGGSSSSSSSSPSSGGGSSGGGGGGGGGGGW
ncbi:conserved membrane hypothetical protein [Pseudomonas sp. 8AS]|uniref:DUF2207 domain-containing protein n=1 Tax=Pseudomonas sp. 8AS TaxID=2653163 RepID=UPI0012F24082|nr:DUF2207 domain-containing protein [Pseudomonas sp. 8AS]VXB04634.1 conserved membrane hypothetical protein [Pseudomonas sp. 8AS]